MNWDEQVSGMIAIVKACVPEDPSFDKSGPYLASLRKHVTFTCHIGCLNTEIGLYAHTWILADARSHLLFEELLAD